MTDQADLPVDPAGAIALAREIGQYAKPFAAQHDRDSTFVSEGYGAIRELGYGALAVPRELGGAGHSLDTICRAQAALARGCANTALAIAMHQHAVLSLAWRWASGDSGLASVLQRVADGLILCSSGTMDLANIGVSGELAKGGVRVSGRKWLASGGPGADVLVTPLAIGTSDERRVLSVMVPLDAPGVTILDSWDAMGMRGSGSNAIEMVDVFVPTENMLSPRPRSARTARTGPTVPDPAAARAGAPSAGTRSGDPAADGARQAHRLPGLLIALPVIASVYLGAAGAVRDQALIDVQSGRHRDDPVIYRLAGLMTHEWRVAWWTLDGLLSSTTDESLTTEAQFVTTMLAKRQIILGSITIVETAMQMLGSMSYMRREPYEQALRDVRAGITHPLAPEATLSEVGRSILDRTPAGRRSLNAARRARSTSRTLLPGTSKGTSTRNR
jgi:alkylation response protein AidB-like acyl-CoA dehydrogenase